MENFSQNHTDPCSESRKLSDRIELKIIYILQCIVGLIALLPNIVTLTLLWRVKVFHANLRLILANLTCNLLIYSISISVKAFERLTQHPCDQPMFLKPCMFKDYFVVVPLHNALLSLVILNLERLYATVRYRSYDFASSCPFLALFLIASAWATSLGLNIPGYFSAPENATVTICELALVGTESGVATVIATMVSFEIVAAFITFFVFFSNRYILGHMAINRAKYDLSARFQVGQNVQLNTALMPGMVLHMFCYLPTYIYLTICFVIRVPLDFETKTWVLHLTYLWRLCYAMIDPILLITLNSNLREALKRTGLGGLLIVCFGKRSNKMKTHDDAARSVKVMNAHFDYLQQMWAAQKPAGS